MQLGYCLWNVAEKIHFLICFHQALGPQKDSLRTNSLSYIVSWICSVCAWQLGWESKILLCNSVFVVYMPRHNGGCTMCEPASQRGMRGRRVKHARHLKTHEALENTRGTNNSFLVRFSCPFCCSFVCKHNFRSPGGEFFPSWVDFWTKSLD